MMRRLISAVPVIDLFAGAGGLSEGFSSLTNASGHAPFKIALSIEKDPIACETLAIRKFVKNFPPHAEVLNSFLRREIDKLALFATNPAGADEVSKRVWNCTLGESSAAVVTKKVRRAIGDYRKPWVLIGGPPCQAYSLAGRSRMKSTHENFSQDVRHFLYREYLEIVARSTPSIFLMENVKGILSSISTGTAIFGKILDDLRAPAVAVGLARNRRVTYKLYGLTGDSLSDFHSGFGKIEDFLVRSERLGIPQARHRVFILGIRSDLNLQPRGFPRDLPTTTLHDVIADLPRIRSRKSDGSDSGDSWAQALVSAVTVDWKRSHQGAAISEVYERARSLISGVDPKLPCGVTDGKYRADRRLQKTWDRWFRGVGVPLVDHDSRSHMSSDLARYFFAACFAECYGRSPELKDFPTSLLPNHKNIDDGLKGQMFSDRFRVQLAGRPATTVTSHIAKDGHYFIHYDPTQARSFTLREAARVQTFPDDYFFAGNRTQQFNQVGNAVPPLLARKVAELIDEFLVRTY